MKRATVLLNLPVFVVLLVLSSCTDAQTALRIKTTAHSESSLPGLRKPEDDSMTIYAVPGKSRVEPSPSRHFPVVVMIQRCDTRMFYTLDLAKHEYTESPLPSQNSPSSASRPSEKQDEASPNLLIDTRTVDTGETKTAFGHTARHYITTTTTTPSPELNQQPSERVVDAWYLDMPDVRTCEPVSLRPRGLISFASGRGDERSMPKTRPEFKYSGPEPQGLVLSQTMTTHWIQVLATGEQQKYALVSSSQIVEMTEVPVDPTHFEVPAGFKKVERISQ